VSDASFQITYAAHTATCTFLLDADGICRRIIPASAGRIAKKEITRANARCVGAQYVASLDASVTGFLADMPRVGSAMLFAVLDERGRVSLVRTGLVTQFEHRPAEDPFTHPAEKVKSASVETSAPEIPPTSSAPRFSRRARPDTRPTEEDRRSDRRVINPIRPEELRAKDRRTLPFGVSGSGLHARTGELQSARPTPTTDPDGIDVVLDDDATLARSAPAPRGYTAPAPATLRAPNALLAPTSDDELDPYLAQARGATLPRPTPPPPAPRMRSERVPKDPPASYPHLDKVAGRRER
jgi:hypothetical protein